MSPLFSLLSLLSLLLIAAPITAVYGGSDTTTEDPLIRQIVDPTLESSDHHPSLTSNPHHHFSEFKKRFSKTYPTQEEHDYRFKVFQANLRRAELNQVLDPTAKHGVTRFSDLTPDEFKAEFLGMNNKLKFPAHAKKAAILPTDNLPLDFDWRVKGAVTHVKNQGGCGSCWSFSATGGLEGAHFLATGKLVTLSEQQLLDCDRECDPEGEPDDCDTGCGGGLMNNAYEYLLKAGGLMREEDYPYSARNGECRFDKSKIAVRVANYSVILAEESQISANLIKHGPLPVGINAAYMSSYISGVSCPLRCGDDLDHGVLLVGYGSSGFSRARMQEKPYWIIKNSWGPYWGEDGYYRLCRGENLCGINNLVSSVAVKS